MSEAGTSVEVAVLCAGWRHTLPGVAEIARIAARLALGRGMSGAASVLPEKFVPNFWDQQATRSKDLVARSPQNPRNEFRGRDTSAAIERVELGIRLADDAEQRRLNRDWRGIDRPTNVLAFPGWDPGEPLPAGAPWLLGDVSLAYETVVREAQQQGKAFADHFRHLVIHGVLHLLGYDHAVDAEAAQMEALETSILARLGVADPYGRTM